MEVAAYASSKEEFLTLEKLSNERNKVFLTEILNGLETVSFDTREDISMKDLMSNTLEKEYGSKPLGFKYNLTEGNKNKSILPLNILEALKKHENERISNESGRDPAKYKREAEGNTKLREDLSSPAMTLIKNSLSLTERREQILSDPVLINDIVEVMEGKRNLEPVSIKLNNSHDNEERFRKAVDALRTPIQLRLPKEEEGKPKPTESDAKIKLGSIREAASIVDFKFGRLPEFAPKDSLSPEEALRKELASESAPDPVDGNKAKRVSNRTSNRI